MSKLHVARMG